MQFRNVLVIEDRHNLFKNGIDLSVENAIYDVPVDIQTAEDWETQLSKNKIPYVLIQCEINLKTEENKRKKHQGYVILIERNNIARYFSKEETNAN